MPQTITPEFIAQFWLNYDRFLKSSLSTETPHPLTHDLAALCNHNLNAAFKLFQQVELDAIQQLAKCEQSICKLQQAIGSCIQNNGNIILIGCGASGRLAVLLRRIAETSNPQMSNRIISICSAGDTSLIRSVESFEDNADFGVQQLKIHFSTNDLVIGLTASGESPFILGAVEYASEHSKIKPWLLFNNTLQSVSARNPFYTSRFNKTNLLDLCVGPMALTGSTRLQATTAMQIAVGLSLIGSSNIGQQIQQIAALVADFPLPNLSLITQAEIDSLKQEEYILYTTNNPILGLSLLADITERSPTFNITPLENFNQNDLNSQFYLALENTTNALDAWKALLGKAPDALNWKDFPQTDANYILGFDVSMDGPRAKAHNLTIQQHLESWTINYDKNTEANRITIQLNQHTCRFKSPNHPLFASIIYKLLLNSHSTLIFGALGYYTKNLMLSLNPSNFKLIDRAIRYCKFLLAHEHQLDVGYQIIAESLFEELDSLEANQSIVKKVVAKLTRVS